MPNRKTATGDNNQILLNIYETARAFGAASLESVKAVQDAHLDWKDAKAVKLVSAEFKLGRIAGSLNLGVRDDALAVLRTAAKKRNKDQQLAYRAAVSAWSECSRKAGMPNKHTGAPRKARAPAVKVNELPRVTVFSVPVVKTRAEVGDFARKMSDILRAFERRNSKVRLNGFKDIFRHFITEVNHAIAEVEAKQETRKTA